MTITTGLHALAERHGYWLEYKPNVRRRGWPQRSARPYHLWTADGTFLAAFATTEALERNLRDRAGC